MKIAFLCGSLEQGSDGVGDYTRALASALIHCGHWVCCISINDPSINIDNCYSRIQYAQDCQEKYVYRFSRETTWYLKLKTINKLLASIKPDWVSLQYVPYSFSRNGLALHFTFLCFLLKGRWQWHFMFHELWIDRGNRFKSYLISITQKLLIKVIVKFLNPIAVTTSIERYVVQLSGLGIPASLLRMHGSIPTGLTQKQLPISNDLWIFVFFGSLDSQWQSEPFFSLVESARRSNGRTGQCHFIKIGKSTKSGKLVWDSITSSVVKKKYPAFTFFDAGIQSEVNISAIFMAASFGISMAPLQWIGKSSSVASMIDHGLSVIVPCYVVSFEAPPLQSFPFAEQLVLIDSSLPTKLQHISKFPIRDSPAQTALSLLAILQK